MRQDCHRHDKAKWPKQVNAVKLSTPSLMVLSQSLLPWKLIVCLIKPKMDYLDTVCRPVVNLPVYLAQFEIGLIQGPLVGPPTSSQIKALGAIFQT